jgi:Ni/Co efflux regulator RcnB
MKLFKRSAHRSKAKEKLGDDKTASSRSGGDSLRALIQADDVESAESKGVNRHALDSETNLRDLYHTQDSTLTEYASNKTHNATVTFDPAYDKGATVDSSDRQRAYRIEDKSHMEEYKKIPTLESIKLPRGGESVDTEAVGRIQVSQLVLVL